MEKDIQLTDRDQVTIYEMSLTFFVIIQQANNFVFSLLNIVDLHLEYEKKIAEYYPEEGKRQDDGTNRRTQAIPDEKHGPWPLKCAYHGATGSDNLIEPEDFLPEMPELRKKRTL